MSPEVLPGRLYCRAHNRDHGSVGGVETTASTPLIESMKVLSGFATILFSNKEKVVYKKNISYKPVKIYIESRYKIGIPT